MSFRSNLDDEAGSRPSILWLVHLTCQVPFLGPTWGYLAMCSPFYWNSFTWGHLGPPHDQLCCPVLLLSSVTARQATLSPLRRHTVLSIPFSANSCPLPPPLNGDIHPVSRIHLQIFFTPCSSKESQDLGSSWGLSPDSMLLCLEALAEFFLSNASNVTWTQINPISVSHIFSLSWNPTCYNSSILLTVPFSPCPRTLHFSFRTNVTL